MRAGVRGSRTAKKVAELRGIPLEALAEATTENAARRFRRPFA